MESVVVPLPVVVPFPVPLPLVVPFTVPFKLVVVPLPLKALFNKSESVVRVVSLLDCVLASAAFTINAPPIVVDCVDSVDFSVASVDSVVCVDPSVEVCSVVVDFQR